MDSETPEELIVIPGGTTLVDLRRTDATTTQRARGITVFALLQLCILEYNKRVDNNHDSDKRERKIRVPREALSLIAEYLNC